MKLRFSRFSSFFKIIISFILIFQIFINSCVNSYGLYAVPYFIVEAISQVAIANGVRLGEEQKEQMASDVYNDMTPEERYGIEQGSSTFLGPYNEFYNSMSISTFNLISSAFLKYLSFRLSNGTYTIETEAIPDSDTTVYLKQGEISAYLKEKYSKYLYGSSIYGTISNNVSKSGYEHAYFFLVTTPNYKTAVCGVFGDIDKFLSECPVLTYSPNSGMGSYGAYEGDVYNFGSAFYTAYSGYSTLRPVFKNSDHNTDVPYAIAESVEPGIASAVTINIISDDFIGPLPTGNNFIKNLKLADGSYVALEDDNLIENEDYVDNLLTELEKEGKIQKTATGEEKVILKPTSSLTETDKSIDIFADPKLTDLTDYEEKQITTEKQITVQEPVLDTDLDTTDIFTTVKSFFLSFWNNLKNIFSTLWNWLKLIYNAILNVGRSEFSFSGLEKIFAKLCVMREDYIKDKLTELFEGYSQANNKVWDNLKEPFVIQEKEIPDIVLNDVTYVNNQYIRDNIGIIREILQSFVTLLFVAGVVKSFFNSFGYIFVGVNSSEGGVKK